MNGNVYQAAGAMTEISKFINLQQQTDTRRSSVFGTFFLVSMVCLCAHTEHDGCEAASGELFHSIFQPVVHRFPP
jgi:hypothetical protein